MYNPFTKAARYLRREYPETSEFALFFGTVGSLVGGGIVLGGAAPLLIIPAMGLGIGGLGGGIAFLTGETNRRNDSSLNLNGYKLIGDYKTLNSIKMTQRLIDGMTKKLEHLPELPAKVQRKIAAHIGDIQGALTSVRVYQSGKRVDTFTFQRGYFDAEGKEQTQAIALYKSALETPPVAKEVTPPQPALPASKSITPEFSELADKVEKLAKQVDHIENPPPVRLDKPRPKQD